MELDLVSPIALQKIFSEADNGDDRWMAFYQRYPRTLGIAAFSPVGFSADGDQAVFAFEMGCGSLCGAGHGVLMRRGATDWAIEDHRLLWVS